MQLYFDDLTYLFASNAIGIPTQITMMPAAIAAFLKSSSVSMGFCLCRDKLTRIINLIVAQTNIPYKIPIGIGYLTNDGNCFAKKKKRNANEMAIKKCTNNPNRESKAGLAKVLGSTAPLPTYLKTFIGVVTPSLFI